MMIVLRSAETLPLLSAAKITGQPCVEIGDASSGMPERVRTEIAPKVEVDPLEVVRRVVGNEHDRHPGSQPFSKLAEGVLRAIHAVERLDPTFLKGVDVNGANSVMSPTEGAPTPKGASQSTTIGVPINPPIILVRVQN
jgi:hypothetical protein